MSERSLYRALLTSVKQRIRQAQMQAALAANAELILLYWDIGCLIHQRQQEEGWGAGIIPRLSNDIHNELPEIKGFSQRNIKRMLRFYREYPDLRDTGNSEANLLKEKVPRVVALLDAEPVESKVPPLVAPFWGLFFSVPWSHHIILLEKLKEVSIRCWYMEQVQTNGWSRDTLASMIRSQLYERQGTAVTNFKNKLPSGQSELASQLLKDPYIFDFLTLEEPFHERELETGLVQHLEKFLLELGQGFAFIGRQHHLTVSDNDYYLDLLFYHYRLHCFVVVDLKRGKFKPEYAGKMNFYCSVVDDQLRQKNDAPTIGLILCQTKDRVIAEYALRDVHKPIGVSDYDLTQALPETLKSSLPSIKEIEAELSQELGV